MAIIEYTLKKMPIKITFYFAFLFLATNTFLFAQNRENEFNYDTFFSNYKFPYPVNFSDKEKQFFKQLDETTQKKIIQFAEQVKNKNSTTTATTTNKTTTASTTSKTNPNNNNQKTLSPLAGLLNSLFKPKNSQPTTPKPPSYSGESGLNDSDPYSNPNFNPDSAPRDGTMRAPLKPEEFVDFSKLPPDTTGVCKNNYGVIGNINGVSNRIKLDTNCLCIAFGGPLKVVSGYRTGSVIGMRSAHVQGLAIDITENNYKNPQKDAMLVAALIGLGYNIGSYHPGFGSFHADRENSGKWKTWSGVANTNYQGAYARNYYQMIQDALNIIGTPAISAQQFRSTYGNPTQSAMSKKALEFIEKNGNEALKQCMSASK